MRDICISAWWSGELKGIDDLICLDPLLGCPFRNSSHFQIGDILILFGWRFYVGYCFTLDIILYIKLKLSEMWLVESWISSLGSKFRKQNSSLSALIGPWMAELGGNTLSNLKPHVSRPPDVQVGSKNENHENFFLEMWPKLICFGSMQQKPCKFLKNHSWKLEIASEQWHFPQLNMCSIM